MKIFVVEDDLIFAKSIKYYLDLNPDNEVEHYSNGKDALSNKYKNPDLIINTCRGEVTETETLIKGLESGTFGDVIIDCWENEPDINIRLLEKCFIGTPHIAGYSRDGKANGTAQSIRAASRYFKLGIDNWYPDVIEPPQIQKIFLNGTGLNSEEIIHSAVHSCYAVQHDDTALRANIKSFEKVRGDYPVRREFPAFEISCSNIHQDTINKLNKLGFNFK